jgi:hypothetical protein
MRVRGPAADRLRILAVLGIAIPGVLALVDALYPVTLWLVVALLLAWRVRRKPPAYHEEPTLYGAIAGALIVMWAPLSRPLLDGDSLLYHLPNAAAFVQTHSVWTAQAPYWLYPPASELFAAGLFAASGRWSLPLAGIVPAALLIARIYSVARDNGASRSAAAGVALAFICTPVAAFQTGTLQNDLWLAAFFVEILTADRSAVSIAVAALLKPFGIIEAWIAAGLARVPLRAIALGILPLMVWAARDAILYSGGNEAGFSVPSYFGTTIAGNIPHSFFELARGIATVTPQAYIWIALMAAGLAGAVSRRYALAGLAAFAVYVFLPVSYQNGITNYALDASSLRYALPALACGALVAASWSARGGVPAAMAAYAIAAWGAYSVLAVFWNDAYSHWAIAVAAVAVAACALHRISRLPLPAALLAIAVAGSWSASSRALGFYGDWMRQPSGKPTGAFAWIAEHHPSRVIAQNVRSGAVIMVSPDTHVAAMSNGPACAASREAHAILFVGSNEDFSAARVRQAFSDAHACGRILYEDGSAVLVLPYNRR